MPNFLVKVASKNRKIDYVKVPAKMSVADKEKFEMNRKTIFKDYTQIQGRNKDTAITKALQKQNLIAKNSTVQLKQRVPKKAKKQCKSLQKGVKQDFSLDFDVNAQKFDFF